jgi:hypothetical protein
MYGIEKECGNLHERKKLSICCVPGIEKHSTHPSIGIASDLVGGYSFENLRPFIL